LTDSSSVAEPDPVEGGAPDVSAESSPQDLDTSGGESLLASVDEALKSSEGETSPDSEAGSETEPAQTTPAEDPLGELTDEEFRKYGPRTQRRIRQLLDARSDLHTEGESLRPKAQHFDKIDEYIRESRITNEDFAVLLELGALVTKDPFKAYERFSAITAQLAKATGHELPPDIQERVRLGYLSEEDARALATSRTRATLAEQRAQEQTQQAQDEQRRSRVASHVQTCRSTANQWEARNKATDPDWDQKQGRIGELIELEVYRNGYPPSQEQVVKMLDGFLQQVNGEFARFKPKPKEIRPVVGSASPRAGAAEPKTLMDAVNAALAR